jgi:hypothetical protein
MWDKIKEVFSVAWDWIKNLLLKYTPVGLIVKHWDTISGWFAGLWDKVKNIFAEKWGAIGKFFSGLKTKFFEWGKNLLQGLIDGIMEMINKPLNMIKNLGKSLGDKFKSILGINSPSRLFMEAGINITRGLTGGIDRGLPAVGKSSGQMAMQAITNYRQSLQVSMERITPISLPDFNYETPEPVYTQLQRSLETSAPESNIIPASKIFNDYNNSRQNTSDKQDITFSPVINIYGNSESKETQQDLIQLLRDNFADMMKRYSENKTRLSFS